MHKYKRTKMGTRSTLAEKSEQMADPLGTLNAMFGKWGEAVLLLGHIDRSGLGNMLRW